MSENFLHKMESNQVMKTDREKRNSREISGNPSPEVLTGDGSETWPGYEAAQSGATWQHDNVRTDWSRNRATGIEVDSGKSDEEVGEVCPYRIHLESVGRMRCVI